VDPSGRVNGGGTLERRFGLSQQAYKQIRFLCQEDANILLPFGLIAGVTRQTEITDPVGAPIRFGLDMLHLQRDISGSTVGAGSVPFLQQVLSDLIARQSSLLVLHATYARIVYLLHIKLDQFQTDCFNGTYSHEPLDPGQDVGNPTF
jgi:hypothetical protein